MDDLALMLARSRAEDGSEAENTVIEADERFWRELPAGMPVVANGDRPGLLSCLRHSDALVADVSSVVSDWLALDRPLATMLPPDARRVEFLAAHPSACAGALVASDGEGLAELLQDLRQGVDPYREQRRRVRADLLGTEPQASQTRFDQALVALCASAGQQGHEPSGERR